MSIVCLSTVKPLIIAAAFMATMAGVVQAGAFDEYGLIQEFELPTGAGPFDVLPDGRIITLVGEEVHIETSTGLRTFSLLGVLPGADVSPWGPAFVRVSPDGTKIAVGNNGGASYSVFEVGVFNLTTFSGDWFAANHYDAAWIDDRYIALAAGGCPTSVVTALDTHSVDPSDPTNRIIIDNIGGASGGVCFDANGNLYTGNGFTYIGPSGTGAVMAFDNASWTTALNGGPAVDFENGGTLVVDVLSASPLAFDAEGNLLVGGGDFSSGTDFDFVAIVRGSALTAALLGFGPADPNDPTEVRRLDPDPANDYNFFTVSYNSVTRQLYVLDFGDPKVFVYTTPTDAIPTVSEWGMVCMGLMLVTVGKIVFNERRRPSSAVTG